MTICGDSPEAKFYGFLWILGKPTISAEKCDIGIEGELEGSMKRIRVLTKFDIGMINHLRKVCGNFGVKTIPETVRKQKCDGRLLGTNM